MTDHDGLIEGLEKMHLAMPEPRLHRTKFREMPSGGYEYDKVQALRTHLRDVGRVLEGAMVVRPGYQGDATKMLVLLERVNDLSGLREGDWISEFETVMLP
jgi:hypothetical protein